jgi:hypothetical protein
MELTLKQVHDYYNLVTEGKAPPLTLLGAEGTDLASLLIPAIDADGVVYFDDMQSGSKIYPGSETVRNILLTLDNS